MNTRTNKIYNITKHNLIIINLITNVKKCVHEDWLQKKVNKHANAHFWQRISINKMTELTK